MYGDSMPWYGGDATGAGIITFRFVMHPDQMYMQDHILMVKTKKSYWVFPREE